MGVGGGGERIGVGGCLLPPPSPPPHSIVSSYCINKDVRMFVSNMHVVHLYPTNPILIAYYDDVGYVKFAITPGKLSLKTI